MDIDFNICEMNEDGKHGPLESDYDPEISDGFVSVMCGACGLCTGFPIPDVDDLEWN